MEKRNDANLIKNVYDDSTIDTLRALDQNITTMMHHNPDYKNIILISYERVPVKPGASASHIKVVVAKNEKSGIFYLTEEFLNRLEESNEIRQQLATVMKQVKMSLKE